MAKGSQKGKKSGVSGASTSKLRKQKTRKRVNTKNGKQSSRKSSVSKASAKKKLSRTSHGRALTTTCAPRRHSLKKRQVNTTENHDSENPIADPEASELNQTYGKVGGKRPKVSDVARAQDPRMRGTDPTTGLTNQENLVQAPQPFPSSQGATYDFRFSDVELTSFLSDVTSFLCRLCCRVTAHITLQVPNSAAFLSVGERGRIPDSTVIPSTAANKSNEGACEEAAENIYDWKSLLMDGGREHEEIYRTVRSTIAASCALSHRSCQALWGPCGSGKHRIVRLVAEECSMQANTFVIQLNGKLLQSDEAAIRAIAQQMLAFLKSPQSEAVRRADWSIRTGTFDFGRLFHFERELSMESTTNTHHGGTNQMSGEGCVFNGGEHARSEAFPPQETERGNRRRGFAPAAAAMGDASNQTIEPKEPWPPTAAHGTIKNAKNMVKNHNPKQGGPSGADNDVEFDFSNEEDDHGGAHPFITSTTTYLSGGAASALPHLQRALLLLKHHGTNLVVCVCHADQFSVWCDRLLYVLSGLMHESDGQGGGMSLLLTSSASDMRQMEKRLSSRLTCITCYVPLLTWTPVTLLRAVLSILLDWSVWKIEAIRLRQDEKAHHQQTQNRAAEVNEINKEGANRRPRKGRARNGDRDPKHNGSTNGADDALEQFAKRAAELSRQKTTLCHLLPFPLDETPLYTASMAHDDGAYFYRPDGGLVLSEKCPMQMLKEGSNAPETPSLYAHPMLALEVLAFVCRQQLCRLDKMCSRTEDGVGGYSSLATGLVPDGADSADFSLVYNVVRLTEELFAVGGTSQASLTALVQCLTKCSSGALDLVSPKDHVEVLVWLRQRQGQEAIWPWMEETSHHDDARWAGNPPWSMRENATLPRFRGCAPLGLRLGPRARAPRDANSSSSPSAVIDPSLLPPNLWGLLDEGHLVRLGYFSRESILVLFYMLMHQEAGIERRSIADLLEDVSSSLGVKAAAALDRAAYRAAIEQLTRWRMLKMREMGESVSLNIGASRLREALRVILFRQSDWCEDILGLDPKDYMRMRSLIG